MTLHLQIQCRNIQQFRAVRITAIQKYMLPVLKRDNHLIKPPIENFLFFNH